ncbi:MAG: ROK family protein [Coriobacteriales bacterium]|nr:ROK family protein [Coriobacteriales bacterium]
MEEMLQAYRTWILAQQIDGCTIEESGDGIVINHELVKGWVNFYEIDGMYIVELRLERVLDGEPAFFLHFELLDLLRAQELFNEMAEALHDMTHRSMRHVLLCCTCGVTTTYFSNKLNELAQGFGLDLDFTAKPLEEAVKSGSEYAAVLLAPQVAHQRKALAEALPGTIVIELPGKIFGAYDANAALKLVVDVLSGNRTVSDDKKQLKLVRDYDRTKKVLALSYIYRSDEPTLSYRVLDCGQIVLSGMLVRRTVDFHTLEDLAATLLVEGWKMSDFDAIGVAVPGVVDKGVVIEQVDGSERRIELRNRLEKNWGTRVYIDYNASAAAVGCYVSQDTYENVAFHAQAVGVAEGEEGYVLGGEPVVGHGGWSGHLGALAKGFALEMDLEDAAWRVNGMRELVARYLTSVTCTVAPDVIYVWCDLLPDMTELHNELAKGLPESAIPELVGVSDYDDCVLIGEMALCLRRLAM